MKCILGIFMIAAVTLANASEQNADGLREKAENYLNSLYPQEKFACVNKNVWDIFPITRNTLTYIFKCNSEEKQIKVVIKTEMTNTDVVRSITVKKTKNIDL